MSHHTEWTVEAPERGWLGRLIAPQDGGRPATTGFLIGALGAAAFVGSLVLDWQTVTVTNPTQGQGPTPDQPATTEYALGLATVDTLSLVYILGLVTLLGIVGAVVTRPDLALRLRLTAAGVTVGLLAVMIAVTVRLPEAVLNSSGLYALFEPGFRDRMKTSYEAGVFFGYAAVVLPMAAIWLAARPAARAATHEAAGEAESAAEAAVPSQPAATRSVPRLDGVPGLIVSAEPLDLTVRPGDPWPR